MQGIAVANAAGIRVADALLVATSPINANVTVYGAAFGGGLTLGLNAYVDVTISGLPLLDAARFLNSVHSGRVLVPAAILTKLNERVRLKVKRKRFADVLDRLGLAASRNPKKREKRK